MLIVLVQAESDAQEKDRQLNDLLVRMAQYEQVGLLLLVGWKYLLLVGHICNGYCGLLHLQ